MAGKVLAEDAFPPPPVACDDTEPTEFSSDRPYQASVCPGGSTTYWCGNDVIISLGNIKVPYCDKENGAKTECPCDGAECDHTGANAQKIVVDLTDVELPILGNTELTKNYRSNSDIDDGTKVSNYVAWYLGGTNDRAEYGYTDPTTAEGVSEIINTSGPLKKLLPSIIQEAIRLETIENVTELEKVTDEGDEDLTGPKQVDTVQNHNQIVVCYTKPVALLPYWLTNFLGTGSKGLGKAHPESCYDRQESPDRGSVLRLKDWNDEGVFDKVVDEIKKWVDKYHLYPSGFISEIAANALIDHWPKRYPPLPWSDKEGKPFTSTILYQKAYNEWRGQLCAIINVPVLGEQLVCVGIPGVTNNDFADLYPFVPLANTVDKEGMHKIMNTHLSAPQATLEDVSYEIFHNAKLFLAHSKENFELSDALKTTYKPQESTESGYISPTSKIPGDVEDNSQCRIVPSRTNPGDDVTFDKPKTYLEVDVEYRVTEIQCKNIRRECHENKTTGIIVCEFKADCSSTIYATINTRGRFAYADQIWENTVAAEDSIFRRIYPKTGAGSPVSCIADTPASSNAKYTLDTGRSDPGLELVRIVEPDGSAVKSDDGETADAQLYYPHYGGVLDYFLNGIQQALRPLGFGPGQPTDGQYCTNVVCGELPELPPVSEPACGLGDTKGLNVPQSLKDIISAAADTYKVKPSLILGVLFGEGAFNQGTYQRYNWTDQNVANWATCEPLPNCSPGDDEINSVVKFFAPYWENLAEDILPDLKKIDPLKVEADPCNLLDAVYALAKDLSTGAGGSPALTGKQCLGITMSSSVASSCNWNDSQLETAIRVWEFGTEWGNTSRGFLTCATKEGSCATGGGVDAQCPSDTSSVTDTCDTSVGANSHNACVFNIAK